MEQSQINTLITIIPAETSQVNLPSFSSMAHKLKFAIFCFFSFYVYSILPIRNGHSSSLCLANRKTTTAKNCLGQGPVQPLTPLSPREW